MFQLLKTCTFIYVVSRNNPWWDAFGPTRFGPRSTPFPLKNSKKTYMPLRLSYPFEPFDPSNNNWQLRVSTTVTIINNHYYVYTLTQRQDHQLTTNSVISVSYRICFLKPIVIASPKSKSKPEQKHMSVMLAYWEKFFVCRYYYYASKIINLPQFFRENCLSTFGCISILPEFEKFNITIIINYK